MGQVYSVKHALAEYRLWLYPDKIMDAPTEKSFEYIGKTFGVEIRVYDNSEKQIYACTSMGEWLALFDIRMVSYIAMVMTTGL